MPTIHLKNFTHYFGIVDLFKYTFFFRIGTRIQNSTFFSIFISLMVIAPLLVYFSLIVNNTLLHTTPKINVQEFDVNQRPYMTLNSENFPLAFRKNLRNISIFTRDIEDYFDFNIYYAKVNHIQNLEFNFYDIQNFTLEKCKNITFPDFQEYFKWNLATVFCLSNHSMDIGGY